MISESRTREVLKLFPVGSFVPTYVEWAETITDAPLIYHVGTALALLGVVAPERLEMRAGGKVLPSFWSLLVGKSRASRKTTAISLGVGLLKDACPYLIANHPGSTEGFLKELEEKAKQILVFVEYGSFLSKTEEGYLGPIREKLTEAYDGEALTRRTLKTKVSTAPVRVSMLAGVTASYLEEHTAHSDWTGGFLARHVIFYAQRERTNTTYGEGNPLTRNALALRLKALADKEGCGPCHGLTAGAQRFWDRWYVEVTSRFAGSVNTWAEGIAEGAPGVALKVALILCNDENISHETEPWEIPEHIIRVATAIAELHIESGMAVVDTLAPTKYEQLRRKVLGAIYFGRPRPIGEIVRAARMSIREVKLVIESLLIEKTIVQGDRIPGTGDATYLIPDYSNDVEPENKIDFATRGEAIKRAREDHAYEAIPSAPSELEWSIEVDLSGATDLPPFNLAGD